MILIIGSLKMAWKGNLLGIRDILATFGTAVKDFWSGLVKFMKEAFSGAIDGVAETFVTFVSFIKGESPEDDSKDANELRRILADIPDDYGQLGDMGQPALLQPDVSDSRGRCGSRIANDRDPGRGD